MLAVQYGAHINKGTLEGRASLSGLRLALRSSCTSWKEAARLTCVGLLPLPLPLLWAPERKAAAGAPSAGSPVSSSPHPLRVAAAAAGDQPLGSGATNS